MEVVISSAVSPDTPNIFDADFNASRAALPATAAASALAGNFVDVRDILR